MKSLLILLPYGGGSHEYWAKMIKKSSFASVEIFSLPGRYWKWRMHGAANYFADLLNQSNIQPDIILTTSMMNIAEFKGLLESRLRDIPVHLYFHENQFAYPISSKDPDKKSDRLEHYQFIQLQSYIAADKVFFNSHYNRESFLQGANQLIKKIPDFKEHLKQGIKKASNIWPIYIDPHEFHEVRKNKRKEVIFIWNHRWEEDKNPEGFFQFLRSCSFPFKIIICGKQTPHPTFQAAKIDFKDSIIHFGEASSRSEYLNLLGLATHAVITSHHDFYGISALELVLSGVKTYFPNRLAYPEHFSVELWNQIHYQKISDCHKLFNYRYPQSEIINYLEKKLSCINQIRPY